MNLSRRRSLAVVLGAILIGIHLASILHFRSYPTEARDYGDLGRKMALHFEPGDMVFVVNRSWVSTPLYYYIDSLNPRYVADDYADALSDVPSARVWLLFFESPRWGAYETTTEEMRQALAGYVPSVDVQALRSRAILYVKDPEPFVYPTIPFGSQNVDDAGN